MTDAPHIVEAPLSPEAAAALLLERRRARVSYRGMLQYWIKVTRAPFLWNWHMEYLCDVLQAIADRDSAVRFTLINIPPRFMKSTLVGQLWQGWMIGREDSRRSSVLSIANTGMLAARDSRKTMQMLESPWYKALFPHVKAGAKWTESEWETGGGAYRIASGVEGTVTGRGADHLVFDDPLKAGDANSDTVREGVNEWLGETLRNRLDDQKTGTITGIMQRLHERDPTGYLVEQAKRAGADKYTIIDLPNEAIGRTIVTFKGTVYKDRADKELLHPERIGPEETAALKVSMRHNYSGQYQQRPTKMQGGHLNVMRLVKLGGTALELKSSLGLSVYFYMDFAQTEKQTQKDDPDFSTIGVFARDQYQRLLVLDIWRKQTADLSSVARQLINMHRLWRPMRVKGEKGGIRNTFMPVLAQQKLLAQYQHVFVEPTTARTRDKITRSIPFKSMVDAGMVCYPETAPFVEDWLAEMRAFPNAAHDDLLEGCFDAAADFGELRVGDAPTRDPDNPIILANQAVLRRIAAVREQQMRGNRPAQHPLDAGW